MPERIEISPSKLKIRIKILAMEALLLPACLFVVLHGERLVEHAFGGFGVLFFGLCGVFGWYSTTRGWSFALTREGIEINLPMYTSGHRRAVIPWHDIEAVGVTKVRHVKMVGIRLSSYNAFIASRGVALSKDYVVCALLGLLKINSVMNILTFITDTRWPYYIRDLIEAREREGALQPWQNAKDITGLLEGNRRSCGYDVAFAWPHLDRPPQAMVNLICEYWRATFK